MPLYVGGTMEPTVTGLSGTDTTTGTSSYLNAATVTYQLYESDMTTTVASGSGTLAYVASSNGNYIGTITSTVTGALTVGNVYWLKYTVVSSPYNDARWERLVAEYRGLS